MDAHFDVREYAQLAKEYALPLRFYTSLSCSFAALPYAPMPPAASPCIASQIPVGDVAERVRTS